MGVLRRWLLVGALSLCCLPGAARASVEVDMLLEKLVEKGVLTRQDATDLKAEMAEFKDAGNKQLAKEIVPKWALNTEWKGDIRLRNEYRNQEGTGNDRNRQRIRFRYGFASKVGDQIKVGARIATGSSSTGGTGGDPVSTNQSFDTNFVKKNISLDLAYLEYSPTVPGLSSKLIGGMMENPFWSVSPLVFDGDLSFDGAAVKVSREMGPATVFSNIGAFSLDTDETEPASLWITQAGASVTPFPDAEGEILKNLKLSGALAYQDYRNVANATKAGTDIIAREGQNTASATDFNQINPGVELASKLMGYPVALYGDWVHNTAAGTRNNDGFQIGVKAGKAANPIFSFGNGFNLKDGWETGYFFQELQADAAFDEFADSDFNDGGTNNRGHAFWLTFATLKSSTFGVKYLIGENLKGAKDVENRVQMDWVTKF